MKAKIEYIRYTAQYGRNIAIAQLHQLSSELPSKETLVMEGSLAQILTYVEKNKIEITNSQDVLNHLVRTGGFAS